MSTKKLKKWEIEAKKREKYKNVCWCGDRFKTPSGLSQHKSRLKHWQKPEQQEPPEKCHVNYFELLNDYSHTRWGHNMTKDERLHPSDFALQMAALFHMSMFSRRYSLSLKDLRLRDKNYGASTFVIEE